MSQNNLQIFQSSVMSLSCFYQENMTCTCERKEMKFNQAVINVGIMPGVEKVLLASKQLQH